MRILHTVQRYAPDTGGSEEVVKQLSEYLVSFGHEVTVATMSSPSRNFTQLNGVHIQEFDCRGNSVEGIYGQSQEYIDFLSQSDADVMMNYAAQIWTSDLAFESLPRLKAKKIFVPCGFSQLSHPLYQKYFEEMPEVLRRYEKVVYLSDNYIDKKFADRNGLDNSVIIPNGADLKEFRIVQKGSFRKKYGIEDRTLILNVSNHSTFKNHAFFWNCIQQLDRNKIAPVLIGNTYTRGITKWLRQCYSHCRFDGIRCNAHVMENFPRGEVVEAYTDADIFLFGSKIECSPLVMFEAFASRTLFVSTDVGNVSDFADVACIVHDEREALEVVREFIAHPDRYQERIEKGHRYIMQEFNWETIARKYEHLYLSVL